MPHFNVFRSRRIENSGITEDSNSFNDGQMPRPPERRQHPPSGFRSILTRNRRARPQTNAHTDDEEWQLLDRPPNMRATVEDYSSDEEPAPSDVTDSSVHYISESSAVDSQVPLVEREDEPISSRLYEQFSNSATPHASHVTRLELQDRDIEDHHRSNGSLRPYMDPPISHSPTLSSSSASIVYTLDDGTRVQVPTASYQRGRSSHRQATRKDKTYYIIPPGMNVIFRDKDGSEITRGADVIRTLILSVGDFTGTSTPMRYQEAPIILRDESGRIIYQYVTNLTLIRASYTYPPKDRVAGNTHSRDGPSVVHLGRTTITISIVLSRYIALLAFKAHRAWSTWVKIAHQGPQLLTFGIKPVILEVTTV
ncbi:hypothetical protein HETIRDRAFT_116684 [Heterobasidion irregulare TC 32-1]|uniref:Uncharacterized protein n=1 Tax=Heterobasidion irregulare (strain TC 32-1) TaxID=747525 RepID=W4KEW4_HETIT|nr:uncharacterized protein HETIRDRAFT_116684 [Heterobasidion irregulare TC 32-1]ETW84378.1 hypothetical protein HETIRDRAFT_116684 [Heterobasidion irregulare TC 32-1]